MWATPLDRLRVHAAVLRADLVASSRGARPEQVSPALWAEYVGVMSWLIAREGWEHEQAREPETAEPSAGGSQGVGRAKGSPVVQDWND
jgi:hypothetical protein